MVSEKIFHSGANDTLDMLQEKTEAYVEDLDVDGFDLDYSDGVMTVKLGDLGTCVLNKHICQIVSKSSTVAVITCEVCVLLTSMLVLLLSFLYICLWFWCFLQYT